MQFSTECYVTSHTRVMFTVDHLRASHHCLSQSCVSVLIIQSHIHHHHVNMLGIFGVGAGNIVV